MPAEVPKAFGLPARPSSRFWATPNCWGRSPRFIMNWNGSAERFRTSVGRAAAVNQFLGKAKRQMATGNNDSFSDIRRGCRHEVDCYNSPESTHRRGSKHQPFLQEFAENCAFCRARYRNSNSDRFRSNDDRGCERPRSEEHT